MKTSSKYRKYQDHSILDYRRCIILGAAILAAFRAGETPALKAHLVREVEVLFRYALSGL